MNPYLSWAVLLTVAGGLGYYYTNGSQSKAKAAVKPVVEKTQSASALKKPKRKVRKTPELSAKPNEKLDEKHDLGPRTDADEEPDEEIDRAEMAKRFAAVKNDTPLTVSSNGINSQKKKKAAAASKLESGSTTGADADDDLSPNGSPVINATVPAAGYVSDMLESPAATASVLRVTGSAQPEAKKQKPQSFKPVETKKQRQQRQKNEARKLQVQEAEEERRRLLEKQLHLAREAERRDAARTAPVPAPNPWTNGTSKPAQNAKVDLLDTFDRGSLPAPATSDSGHLAQGLPSEEEQIRLLGATSESDWTTVSTKKIKKKGGKVDGSVSASETESQTAAPAPTVSKPVELPQVSQVYIPDILRSGGKRHPLDSDWAA